MKLHNRGERGSLNLRHIKGTELLRSGLNQKTMEVKKTSYKNKVENKNLKSTLVKSHEYFIK